MLASDGSTTITTLTGTTITGTSVRGGITSGTSVASTSGTSIDFTSIPSWVKRVTVMFNGVSMSGTSHYLVQLGSGSITTTGYSTYFGYVVSDTSAGSATSTAGLGLWNGFAASTDFGLYTIALVSGNIWVANYSGATVGGTAIKTGGGGVTLSGTLDRVRITTVNGTDTFDAGSINILYEG